MKIFENENEEENRIGQETEEDDTEISKETLSEAVLWGTDWTTETLVTQLKKKNIELSPSFQRRDAWGDDRKSKFIESIILGLPIPQIILAERKDKKGSYIVIDGKQRLLSLRQFCASEDNDDFSALILRDLQILETLNGKTYQKIIDNFDLSDFYLAFENQSIRTVIIKNWPSQQFLYTVFYRLNTGSLPLSPQELRQALIPGPFTTFVDDFAIESGGIKKILKLKKPDYRMRDVEVVVRFFAFRNFIEDYNGKLKEFLDRSCEELNEIWKINSDIIKNQSILLEESISSTYEIFGEDAYSKYSGENFTGIFNRPVFDIMSYYFCQKEIATVAIKKKEDVKKGFINLCKNNYDFLRSLETSTKNIEATALRFSAWGSLLKEITGLSFPIPTRADVGIKLK